MLLRIAASRACACYVLCTYIVCYARIHLVISLAVAQSVHFRDAPRTIAAGCRVSG